MADLAPFPDIEAALCALFADLGTVDVDTPSDLQNRLPFIRVQALGGTDDRFNDHPRIDVDCFAAQRTDAVTLAELARQRLLSFPHILSDCVVDDVSTTVRPQEIPWSNTAIRLVAASYTVTTRRNS